MHPLGGAYVRLDRAKKHLAELKALDAAFVDEEIHHIIKTISVEFDPDRRGRAKVHYKPSGKPVPVEFFSPIGDTLHNARVALDYLIYELALLDSSVEQSGTQFPIDNSQDVFRRGHRRLRGLNATHIAMIEGLQPYNGVKWTAWLRDLSNPDKHRHLTVTMQGLDTTIRRGEGPHRTKAPDAVGAYIALPYETLDGKTMHVEFCFTTKVAFENQLLPVMDTLQEITTQVGNTLANFKSEF